MNIKSKILLCLLAAGCSGAYAQSLTPVEAPAHVDPQSSPCVLKPAKELRIAAKADGYGVTPGESVNGQKTFDAAPAGSDVMNLYRSGEAYYIDWFGQVVLGKLDGEMSSVVVTDNEVWILNPFGKMASGTWIKGTLDARGNVSVSTPQCVAFASNNSNGTTFPLYLVNVKLQVSDDGKEATYVEDKQQAVIKYKWDGNALTLEEGQPGLCFWRPDSEENVPEEWMWFGYADLSQRFEPCPYSPLVPPSDMEYEDYTLVSYDYYSSNKQGDIVQVGFDDDGNIWIKNLHKILTDYIIKGEKTDGGYIFKTQYLGPIDYIGSHIFFLPGFYTYIDDIKAVGSSPEMMMQIDAETRSLYSASENVCWFINCGKGDIRFLQCNEDPSLSPYIEKEDIVLSNPVNVTYDPPTEENGMSGYISFDLSAFDPAGDYIDTQCLSYNIMTDGEPMVFDPSVYFDFESPVTDIPFALGNYDILVNGSNRMVYLYSNDFERIGVRLNYDKNGKRVSSEIVETPSSGIEAAFADKTPVSVEYTDLVGHHVLNPSSGIFIRTTKYTDGSVKTDKIVIKR